MKPSDKSKTAALLKRFETSLERIDSSAKELNVAVKAAESILSTIEKIGSPKFSDEAAIERLTKARIRLPLAQQAVDEGEDAMREASSELTSLMNEAVDLCQSLMVDAFEAGLKEIVDTLAPFYAERARAVSAARDTDEGRRMTGIIRALPLQVQATFGCLEPERLRTYAEPFIAVLREASKDKPDMSALLRKKPTPAAAG